MQTHANTADNISPFFAIDNESLILEVQVHNIIYDTKQDKIQIWQYTYTNLHREQC